MLTHICTLVHVLARTHPCTNAPGCVAGITGHTPRGHLCGLIPCLHSRNWKCPSGLVIDLEGHGEDKHGLCARTTKFAKQPAASKV
eukprot:1161376-Pelagomonas_calceolata.AAC.4